MDERRAALSPSHSVLWRTKSVDARVPYLAEMEIDTRVNASP
jgi:hypothetical protein